LHWFHKRLEANVKNPRENRCFQTVIVFSFGSFYNSNKCTVLLKIAARLITVSTSVNKEMWVKLSPKQCRAEIWTTGRIGSEAKRQFDRTEVRQSVAKKIRDCDSILDYLPSTIRDRCSQLLKTIAMADETSAGQMV